MTFIKDDWNGLNVVVESGCTIGALCWLGKGEHDNRVIGVDWLVYTYLYFPVYDFEISHLSLTDTIN